MLFVQGPYVNVCCALQASDESRCDMNSTDISSLYTAPTRFDDLEEMLAETSLTRVTFAGRVIYSMVCTCFCMDLLR